MIFFDNSASAEKRGLCLKEKTFFGQRKSQPTISNLPSHFTNCQRKNQKIRHLMDTYINHYVSMGYYSLKGVKIKLLMAMFNGKMEGNLSGKIVCELPTIV